MDLKTEVYISLYFIYLFIYLFWLRRVLVAACGIFIEACGMFRCGAWASLSLWHAGSRVHGLCRLLHAGCLFEVCELSSGARA